MAISKKSCSRNCGNISRRCGNAAKKFCATNPTSTMSSPKAQSAQTKSPIKSCSACAKLSVYAERSIQRFDELHEITPEVCFGGVVSRVQQRLRLPALPKQAQKAIAPIASFLMFVPSSGLMRLERNSGSRQFSECDGHRPPLHLIDGYSPIPRCSECQDRQ